MGKGGQPSVRLSPSCPLACLPTPYLPLLSALFPPLAPCFSPLLKPHRCRRCPRLRPACLQEEGEEEAVLTLDEVQVIQGALDMASKTAESAMTPLDMVGVGGV